MTDRCVGSYCGGESEPEVILRYHTSMGPVEAPVCMADAKAWQKMFGHTPAGQTLSIRAYVAAPASD